MNFHRKLLGVASCLYLADGMSITQHSDTPTVGDPQVEVLADIEANSGEVADADADSLKTEANPGRLFSMEAYGTKGKNSNTLA